MIFTILLALLGLLGWVFTGKPLFFVYFLVVGLAIDIFSGGGIYIYKKFWKH
jgi:hypothetical protein